MDGATTESPQCTARIANSSSCGGTSFSRNPLAPAFSAANAYSSRSNVVSMSTLGRSPAAQIRRTAATPSSRGIRTSITMTSAVPRAASATASSAVGGLAGDAHVRLRVQHHPEPGPHQLLIVDERDPDRRGRRARRPGHAAPGSACAAVTPGASGSVAVTRQPPPGRVPR